MDTVDYLYFKVANTSLFEGLLRDYRPSVERDGEDLVGFDCLRGELGLLSASPLRNILTVDTLVVNDLRRYLNLRSRECRVEELTVGRDALYRRGLQEPDRRDEREV